MILIIYICASLYFLLIFLFFIGYKRIKDYEITSETCKTYISVVISAKNEEHNISDLLDDLKNQDYDNDMYEVIIINDNSTDNTSQILSKYCSENKNYRFYDNKKKGKKSAISQAVNLSKGGLILTTDADCRVSKRWLTTVSNFYEKTKAKLIIAPVSYVGYSKSIFKKLQTIEFLSLQASTAGAAGLQNAIMCNGANMAYEKKIFEELEDPNFAKVASGDDVFLMLNIKKNYRKQIYFLKNIDAIVNTKPSANLRKFISQRKRWSSKSVYMNDLFVIITGLIVASTNFLLFISFIFAPFYSICLKFFFILFCVKTISDFILLMPVSKFFSLQKLMFLFLPLQFIYFFYVVTILTTSLLFHKNK